jgi:hypothetical protein
MNLVGVGIAAGKLVSIGSGFAFMSIIGIAIWEDTSMFSVKEQAVRIVLGQPILLMAPFVNKRRNLCSTISAAVKAKGL